MTNVAVPSSPLNHTHANLPYPPLFCSPFPNIVIIYSNSYNFLFLCLHSSLHITHFFPHFELPLSIPIALHLPLLPSHSVSRRGSAIEDLHMIVFNGFDLLARLSLPSFLYQSPASFSLWQPASKVSLLTKSSQSVISFHLIDLKCMSQ